MTADNVQRPLRESNRISGAYSLRVPLSDQGFVLCEREVKDRYHTTSNDVAHQHSPIFAHLRGHTSSPTRIRKAGPMLNFIDWWRLRHE